MRARTVFLIAALLGIGLGVSSIPAALANIAGSPFTSSTPVTTPTSSSIGAVSKAGDTMSGGLSVPVVDAGYITTGTLDAGFIFVTGVMQGGANPGVAIGQIAGSTRAAVCLSTTNNPTSATCEGIYDLSGTLILNTNAGIAGTIAGVTRWQMDATGKFTIGAAGTAVGNWIEGTGTLDFASAAAGACSADLTITVTSAIAGDECSVGVLNASVPAGSVFYCWISGTSTATVRHCCINGTCDPASGVFRARVTNH